ncbi:MAG: tRNA epoxyqueuosine(34) reductase QueG [Planctomycetota bacterium]|nr:tRNA epoxyqueuosine(34) reductase QueG [Planctomycetota bacterium]
MDDAARAKSLAAEHGFPLSGIAAVPPDGAAPQAEWLAKWLEAGRQGPLEYMARTAETRRNLHARFPWARSVLCVAARHDGAARGERGRDLIAHVARYARGRDYHLVFEKRLKRLAGALKKAGLCAQARYYADTGPVLERAWAQEAGMGWVGKNACLIHPKLGSFVLLGEILLDRALNPDAPAPDHCGTCTRCLEACPTQAFAGPGQLDARRCIVTWNLELAGAVPEAQWAEHHGWAAGCDVCQTVCPFNAPERSDHAPDTELAAPLPWQTLTLAEAIELDRTSYDRAFQASALRRTGWKGLRLGAITAAGNLRSASARAALARCLADPDADIRARAAWALRQCE